MLFQKSEGLLLVVANVSVRGQVDVALLLNPGEGLPGRPLEQTELLVLVEPLLLSCPVFQNAVFLRKKLLEND